ncbi:rhomboid family intramembrane serine protease [Xanthomonadaceae bacterium JHOS43]|nr:rhomboid family intramembrane serine protease [Xanthomonadaceae bacterium JHOS43]
MLILPLHRPLTRATFPFVSAALVFVNVVVFALFQSGDGARVAALDEWYRSSGLAQLEWPDYLRYLENQGNHDERQNAQALDEGGRGAMLFQARLMDVRLESFLRDEARARGEAAVELVGLQRDYDERAGKIVTYRFVQRHSELDPVRLVAHAFLHGDVMHLVGNMFFLAALGLLVEGALGPWRFVALYLVGVAGAGLFSAAWNWGTPGGGLGASGAIAALMGAFCMLWGTRPVRFFWWFFVLFDYVRKPAIWLLPAWIGWEAFNMLFNREAGVGFDAHLGGLIVGALAGWACVKTDQVRHDFLDETDEVPDIDAELAAIRTLMGRMDLAAAEVRLDELAEREPQRLDVALARHRAAALAGRRSDAVRHALSALELPAANVGDVALQRAVLEECLPLDRPVPPGRWRDALRRRWLMLGQFAQVEVLLERWLADEADAAHWFELALRQRDAGDQASFHRLLTHVSTNFPAAPEATKARFLLGAV